jgi:hypothetical protein
MLLARKIVLYSKDVGDGESRVEGDVESAQKMSSQMKRENGERNGRTFMFCVRSALERL